MHVDTCTVYMYIHPRKCCIQSMMTYMYMQMHMHVHGCMYMDVKKLL